MKRTIDWKSLKFLFWLAPVLVTAGLTVGFLSGWGIAAFVLLALGLWVAIAWVVVETRGGFWQRRSTQVGTNAVIATVSVLVILGLINFLGVRYSHQFDLTEGQLYTLAPQTQEVLQELDTPTKVWVFSPTPNPNDEKLLENYARTSDQFTFEYVDPQANPVMARDFGVTTPGEVYIESGGDRRQIQSVNQMESLSERNLTNAIVNFTAAAEPSKVYFVQGHGERPLEPGQGGFAEVLKALEQENYTVQPITLVVEGGVPEDADVVIIAGPQRELLEPELKALEAYLQRPSGVMLLLDPTFNTGLDDLLAEWGISLGEDSLIVDPSGQALGLGPGVPLVTQYGSHPITEDLDGISFYPLAQPVALEEVADVTATPILITGADAQVQRIDENGQVQTDTGSEQQGPFAVGVAAEREVSQSPSSNESDSATEEWGDAAEESAATPEAEESPTESEPTDGSTPAGAESQNSEEESAEASPTPEEDASPSDSPGEDANTPNVEGDSDAEPEMARLVVIGNASFASDGIFEQQLNGDVFLNAVNWLNQNDEAIAIRPKEVTNRRILLTTAQQLKLAVASLFIVPLVGFAIAFALWWRRR
ncbi:MAG: Gldg family protein [Synechococcales cyanobacterium T60_A2020_003]|nr:Gldg family protein [Synechococcales cyanobacterium T60_A2020_003]